MDPKEKAASLEQRFADKPSLTRKAGSAALWQVAGGGWQTIIRLGASTILARKLDPSDFGLFGMALLVSELIMVLTNLGMGTGIVAKKHVTEKDLNTCFWTMAGVRITMFVIAEVSAPLAALYFRDPRVTDIVRVVGFTFLFSIPSVVSNTLLSKELRFKAPVLIRGFSTLLESSLAVLLVLMTSLGYWSLVIPMLVASLFAESTIFFVVGWRPRFVFDKESFNYLFRYGINGLGFSITNYLHQNIDYLIVGRLLGSTSLGFYQFAYNIPHLILDRFARPVGSVVFPALSKVQDDDERLIGGYVKAAQYIALGAFPVLGGLAVLATPIVTVLWGEKWLPIVTPLRILCLASAIYCTVQSLGSVFYCKQRPDIIFKFGAARLVFTFGLVAVLGHLYGLVGISVGILASHIPDIYILHVAFRMTRSSPKKLIAALLAPLVCTCICISSAYATWAVLQLLPLAKVASLTISVGSGGLAYLYSLILLFPHETEVLFNSMAEIFGKETKAISILRTVLGQRVAG